MARTERFQLPKLSDIYTEIFYGLPKTVGTVRVERIDSPTGSGYYSQFDTVVLDLGKKDIADLSRYIFKAPRGKFREKDLVEVLVRRARFPQDGWMTAIRPFDPKIYGSQLDTRDKMVKDMFSAGWGNIQLSPVFYERFIKNDKG